jgi:hypothetical protein
VELPPYVDARLAYERAELPLLPEQPDEPWEWRCIAVVLLDGVARDVCAGFRRHTGELELLGILKLDRRTVVPLGGVAPECIRRAAYPYPMCERKKGVSLYLLGQHCRYVESHLVRSFKVPYVPGTPAANLLAELRAEVFGDEQPPSDMDEHHILFYCAATLTARAFFTSRVYGGAANMAELVGAYEMVRTALGEDFAGEDDELMRDLQHLGGLRADKWNEEALRLQRHIAAVLLALLRFMEWRATAGTVVAVV